MWPIKFSKYFKNMFVVIRMTVSKIGRGRRTDGSGNNEINYNLLKMQFTTTIEHECIINGLPLHRFAFSTSF